MSIDRIRESRLRPSVLVKRLKEVQNKPLRFKPQTFLEMLVVIEVCDFSNGKHEVERNLELIESVTDNSIEKPDDFIKTNVLGTFNLIDVAKNHWMKAPFQAKSGYENCRFHHISTDEVFGTLGKEGLFKEDTSYAPNSPYSASKASSDFIVRSYFLRIQKVRQG